VLAKRKRSMTPAERNYYAPAMAWEIAADGRRLSTRDVHQMAAEFASGKLVPPRGYEFEGRETEVVLEGGFYWLVAVDAEGKRIRDWRCKLKLGRAAIVLAPELLSAH
jgi:hypothetical protein